MAEHSGQFSVLEGNAPESARGPPGSAGQPQRQLRRQAHDGSDGPSHQQDGRIAGCRPLLCRARTRRAHRRRGAVREGACATGRQRRRLGRQATRGGGAPRSARILDAQQAARCMRRRGVHALRRGDGPSERAPGERARSARGSVVRWSARRCALRATLVISATERARVGEGERARDRRATAQRARRA